MEITLSIHEIVSWIVAAISLTLFIYERRKNNLTPFYMNLQGLLKHSHAKAVFYWQLAKTKKEVMGKDANSSNEILMWESVSADFEALKQSIMGIMKAIEPNKDTPFDASDYTRVKNYTENTNKTIPSS